MERRDILKEQIEQLGRVLGKITANFIGLKTQGSVQEEPVQATNQALQTELNLDIDNVLQLEDAALAQYLDALKFNEQHLDQLAHYLYEAGKHHQVAENHETAQSYFQAAGRLLLLLEEQSSTITFARIALKQNITRELP